MNFLEITKIAKQALKNQNRYKEKLEKLRSQQLWGEDPQGQIQAYFNMEKYQIERLECKEVSPEILEAICFAVNCAFEKANKEWDET